MNKVKILRDPESGLTWAIRLVTKGDRYGLDDVLTHEKDEQLVEFYDTRYAHTDLGQFVSRYYAGTLLEGKGTDGLYLDLGIPEWSVSAKAMALFRQWLASRIGAKQVSAETLRTDGDTEKVLDTLDILAVRQGGQVEVFDGDGMTHYGSLPETVSAADVKRYMRFYERGHIAGVVEGREEAQAKMRAALGV